MEIPGIENWANDVIAAVDEDGWNVADLRNMLEEPVVCFEKRVVHEIVTFDAGDGKGMILVCGAAQKAGIWDQSEGRLLPYGPPFGSVFLET